MSEAIDRTGSWRQVGVVERPRRRSGEARNAEALVSVSRKRAKAEALRENDNELQSSEPKGPSHGRIADFQPKLLAGVDRRRSRTLRTTELSSSVFRSRAGGGLPACASARWDIRLLLRAWPCPSPARPCNPGTVLPYPQHSMKMCPMTTTTSGAYTASLIPYLQRPNTRQYHLSNTTSLPTCEPCGRLKEGKSLEACLESLGSTGHNRP